MSTLERINELKKEGLNENKIFDKLREEGVSPMEIKDSFDQLSIKNAVSSENSLENNNTMEENYMPSTPEEDSQNSGYPDQSYTENTQYPEQNFAQAQEEYYSPQAYQGDYSQQGYGVDTSTIMEISEQVFAEKTQETEKQINKITEFMNLAESRISDTDKRLERIERIIDNLQIKILEQVGNYGNNLNNIKKEMEMMQDSFSKTLPKFAESYEAKTKKK